MKHLLIVPICLLIPHFVFSQQVKFKKGFIEVDKQEKYEVVKTEKGGIAGLSSYVLKDKTNSELLIFKDTTFYYEELPHEINGRDVFLAYELSAPQINRKELIPRINSLNFGRTLTKMLEELDFFKTEAIDENFFTRFIEHENHMEVKRRLSRIDSVNQIRVKNYNDTKEMFGPLFRREPGMISIHEMSIRDRATPVGNFRVKEKKPYAQIYDTYEILNRAGIVIGTYAFIPSKKQGNALLFANNKRLFFDYDPAKQPKPSGIKNPNADPMAEKFLEVAEYLIIYGYL